MGRAVGPDLLGLVGVLYDAALDENRWLAAIQSIGEAVGAETYSLTVLAGMKERAPTVVRYVAASEDPAYLDSYARYYLSINPYVAPAPIADGSIYATHALVPTREAWRTEFYNDWQRPQGLDYCAGVIFDVEPYKMLLNFNRRKKFGGFDAAALEMLEPLLPHLRRAATLGVRLGTLTEDWGAARHLLARMRMGVMLLDGDGRPVFVNPSAEDVLRANRGLRVVRQRVVAEHPPDDRALQQAIRAAVRTTRGEGLHTGADLRVRSADGGEAVTVSVVPMRGRQLGLAPTGRNVCAALLLMVPGIVDPVPEESLRMLLGLSPAEARLVARLADDQTVAEAAAALGIAEQTARNQLKSALQKVGVRRQAELIRRVLALPVAWMRSGSA